MTLKRSRIKSLIPRNEEIRRANQARKAASRVNQRKARRDFLLSEKEQAVDPDLVEVGCPVDTKGMYWEFDLFPLSKREEEKVLRENRWFKLNYVKYGSYKVAPSRYDIRNFQRKFWISREISSLLVSNLSNVLTLEDLKFLRWVTLKFLGDGSKGRSSLQERILSSVYYCLRQCSSVY